MQQLGSKKQPHRPCKIVIASVIADIIGIGSYIGNEDIAGLEMIMCCVFRGSLKRSIIPVG